MPIQIEICADHLHVRWSGIITAADLAQLFGELPAAVKRCRFTPHVLHTMEEEADLRIDTIEAFNYSKRRIPTAIPEPVRGAFVAHTPASVAIARNFANFNRSPNLTLRSFVSEKAALAWLRDPGHPGTPDRTGPARKTRRN